MSKDKEDQSIDVEAMRRLIVSKEDFIEGLASMDEVPDEIRLGIPLIEAMLEDIDEDQFQELLRDARMILCPRCPLRDEPPAPEE